MPSSSSTVYPPPPLDPSKPPIEHVLELTPLPDHGFDVYTNTRPLWHPPTARGIYGGSVIAQSLSAAMLTLPSPSSSSSTSSPQQRPFHPHSLHAYFLLPGDATLPVLYHIERLRDGRSFITRTVQAKQKGRCIFTMTCSFVREGNKSQRQRSLEHGVEMPVEGRRDVEEGRLLEGFDREEQEEENESEKVRQQGRGGRAKGSKDLDERNGVESQGPFIVKRLPLQRADDPKIYHRTATQWVKARKGRRMSSSSVRSSSPASSSLRYSTPTNSTNNNLPTAASPASSSSPPPQPISPASTYFPALAYISDSWFIGTVPRLHGIFGETPPSSSLNPSTPPTSSTLSMMVSLDHTIYFHNTPISVVAQPGQVKGQEQEQQQGQEQQWMYSEMWTPWSGDGRGVVGQRIWSRGGVLLASCMQEGVVRLKQEEGIEKPSTMSKL